MTVNPDEPCMEAGTARADNAHERTSTVGPERPGGSSPFRILFAIVPLLVIVVVGANLLGLWTTSVQQAAREERLRQAEPPRVEEEAAEPLAPAGEPPASTGAGFDARVVTALLADATPEQGAAMFRMCMPCHAGEKDAPARLAPNLWGIVGRAKAATPGYAYSAALKARGGVWSYEELAEFLHNPRKFAPGTTMAFWGIADNEKATSLIAYLRTLSDDPPPLPGQAR